MPVPFHEGVNQPNHRIQGEREAASSKTEGIRRGRRWRDSESGENPEHVALKGKDGGEDGARERSSQERCEPWGVLCHCVVTLSVNLRMRHYMLAPNGLELSCPAEE